MKNNNKKTTIQTFNSRSEAAKKGWETRRAKALTSAHLQEEVILTEQSVEEVVFGSSTAEVSPQEVLDEGNMPEFESSGGVTIAVAKAAGVVDTREVNLVKNGKICRQVVIDFSVLTQEEVDEMIIHSLKGMCIEVEDYQEVIARMETRSLYELETSVGYPTEVSTTTKEVNYFLGVLDQSQKILDKINLVKVQGGRFTDKYTGQVEILTQAKAWAMVSDLQGCVVRVTREGDRAVPAFIEQMKGVQRFMSEEMYASYKKIMIPEYNKLRGLWNNLLASAEKRVEKNLPRYLKRAMDVTKDVGLRTADLWTEFNQTQEHIQELAKENPALWPAYYWFVNQEVNLNETWGEVDPECDDTHLRDLADRSLELGDAHQEEEARFESQDSDEVTDKDGGYVPFCRHFDPKQYEAGNLVLLGSVEASDLEWAESLRALCLTSL